MSSEAPKGSSSSLTEEAARRVVARALQLQASSGDVRIADLRAAASDLGIAEPHFDAALSEELAGRARLTATRPTVKVAASAGIFIGVLAGASLFAPHYLVPVRQLTFGALMMASGALALRHRWTQSPGAFQLSNAALWGTFCATFAMLAPLSGFTLTPLEWVSGFGSFWGITAAAGVVVTRTRRIEAHDGGNAPPSGPVRQIRSAMARGLRWLSTRIEPHVRFRVHPSRPSFEMHK